MVCPKVYLLFVVVILFCLPACVDGPSTPKASETGKATAAPGQFEQRTADDLESKLGITAHQLASPKDPACGMPAFPFMQDTMQIDNKIYGFCSKACKERFAKSPRVFLEKEQSE